MESELKITWDGTAPGLAEQRLSIGAFGEPLINLLTALRRIAHHMVSEASEGEKSPTGRLVNVAKNLDIEISTIKKNSSGVDALITFRESSPQYGLFSTFAERATVELLDALERESNGEPANFTVRRYLGSLPAGTTSQRYELLENGKLKRQVTIGNFKLAELPPELPSLRIFEGNIVGVGFEPGRSEIRFKSEESSALTASAKSDEVNKGLDMRRDRVRALLLNDGKRNRLIGLNRASDSRFKFEPVQAEKYIFERWKNVLKELAK